MKELQKKITKYPSKEERSRRILLGITTLYLQSGLPIGSETLRQSGFSDLSSSTLRNYFSLLEEEGYLRQPHVSGGRIPTYQALRFYAEHALSFEELEQEDQKILKELGQTEVREVASFLGSSAEMLSEYTGCAVFLSAPRFDQDIVLDIKCLWLDSERFLAAVMTDFGVIQTEILYSKKILTIDTVKKIENYCVARLQGSELDCEIPLDIQTEAKAFYNELMARFIISYSTFHEEEIFRCGFSRLLNYKEMQDPVQFTQSLALFENTQSMRLLLRESMHTTELKYWIGEDLKKYTAVKHLECAVIVVPYYISGKPVGAIGLMGPCRLPYKRIFAFLKGHASQLSFALTKSLQRYKIQFRAPKEAIESLKEHKRYMLDTPKD